MIFSYLPLNTGGGGLPPVSPMEHFTITTSSGINYITSINFSNNLVEEITIPNQDSSGNELFLSVGAFVNPASNLGNLKKVYIQNRLFTVNGTISSRVRILEIPAQIEEVAFVNGFPFNTNLNSATNVYNTIYYCKQKRVILPQNAFINNSKYISFVENIFFNDSLKNLWENFITIDDNNLGSVQAGTYYTFYNVTSTTVTNVNLNKLVAINSRYFGSNCTNINFIIPSETLVPLYGSFLSDATNCFLYVPDALVNEYRQAENYSTHPELIKAISELPQQ